MPHKKVLMLLNAPYPTDIRVKKEADALLQAGFQVFLLCLSRNNEKTEETVEGIRVIRIHAGKNNIQLSYWDMIMSMRFAHPRFEKAAARIIRDNNIELVHIHDLPLAGAGIRLRKKLQVKLIVDFHENYPEALKTWFAWKKSLAVKIKNRIILNPSTWFKHERKACEQSDVVIAVVDEMKERLLKDHGIPADKVVVVTNTESKNFISVPLDENIYKDFSGKFVVAYSGGLGPHRGLHIAIEGMKYLTHEPNIQLVIIGPGSSAVINHLKGIAQENNLQNVHFTGAMPFVKMFSTMHFAGVNLIPHVSNGHTDNTIPHKLFQAMMSGRPLLVSSSPPLKRYVELVQSGLIFKAGDAKDFADKVMELYQNPELCAQLGNNGKQATLRGNLNWEFTQKTLVDLYESLA